jgi:transglutaminase-like putative cysteine protease
MRFSITHAFNYAYDSPVRLSTQYLRLTPRDTARQKVLDWKLDTPGQALRTTDGYGNVLHVLTLDKAVFEIGIEAEGTVETSPSLDEPSDFAGVPLSPLLFLRPTGLTRADEALGALAEKFRRRVGTLSGLRELAAAIQVKDPAGSAADAAHAFIACCRHLGVPARYVSGYMHLAEKSNGAIALHAWAEAWVVDRWRSFDVAHDSAIGEHHIKLAHGADYLDACPVRGVRTGGGVETLIAQVQVLTGGQQ